MIGATDDVFASGGTAIGFNFVDGDAGVNHGFTSPRSTPGTIDARRSVRAGPKRVAGPGGRAPDGALRLKCTSAVDQGDPMGFDQYHEPPQELPPATRTFARLCASLTEEAEAIGWYQQRLAVESDPEASAVMRDAMGEEFKHFSMDLEFLLRRTPVWREIAQGILFQAGDIVEHGEEAEAQAGDGSGAGSTGGYQDGSLGIGGMRGASR
jgi:uncharacterized protein